MEQLNISKQTLQEFIDAPFNIPNKQKNLKYEDRYQEYRRSNKIKIESSIEFEKNYFIHLKVPSESQKKNTTYDVVVQFFTPNNRREKELSVINYYVQFFSNSPGFVYKYASLYKIEGYLIESLYDKFDTTALNTLPDKSNPKYDLYFDSSIYYACRYLLDNRLTVLGKLNLRIFKTKPVKSFFGDIQDTEEINISREVGNIEKNLKKEIDKDQALSNKEEAKIKKTNKVLGKQLLKKRAKQSTIKNKPTGIKVIKPKSSTGNKVSIKRITTKNKKTSTTKDR